MNEFPPTPEIEATGARIIYSPTNQVTLGRFLAAQQARYPICFTQDDDLLAHNIPALLAAYDREPQIVANLASDKSSRHWEWWAVNKPPWVELGFGSVFPRDWAFRLNDWPYDAELLRRKADKVFSVIHPWRAIRAGPGDITRLHHAGKESGRDEHALSNRPDHQALTKEAVRLAQEWSGVAAARSK